MSSIPDPSNLSFVTDLNTLKDIWNMKARVIRKWKLPYKLELILVDEKCSKIQASIKNHFISVFEKQLCEDDVIILCKFGVGENKDMYTVNVLPSLQSTRFRLGSKMKLGVYHLWYLIEKLVRLLDLKHQILEKDKTRQMKLGFLHMKCGGWLRKASFKIEASDYNLLKEYRVYTVNKICDDPSI